MPSSLCQPRGARGSARIHMPRYHAASKSYSYDNYTASQASALSEITKIVCILCRGPFKKYLRCGQDWSVLKQNENCFAMAELEVAFSLFSETNSLSS